MTVLERFLKYIKIDTTSDEHSNSTPSTISQVKFAKMLIKELKELGIEDIIFDEKHAYIYAKLKGDETLPKIGFLSHMDTSSSASGKNITPIITNNYNGESISLNNDNITLDPKAYKDLKNHIGKTLITSNGQTLLGADDKAGIAEIMTMLEYYINSDAKRGDILVCFTPDEEISRGTKYLDYTLFNPDVAYTVDGASLGEFSYENFNAATITIDIKGVETHLGDAKDKMINAIRIATIIDKLVPSEYPETTEGKEGYFHLDEINGTPSKTTLKYLIRDFDSESFEKRKDKFRKIVEEVNKKFPGSTTLIIEDRYKNMYDAIMQRPEIIDTTIQAIKNASVTPIIEPIRGGTDGTNISYNGIPCPNLGTGGHNFHSIYEYICKEDMEKVVEILLSIVYSYSKSENQMRK